VFQKFVKTPDSPEETFWGVGFSNNKGNMSDKPHSESTSKAIHSIQFDLGTFEGFNFRHQCAIRESLTGDQVINWNHDKDGEAEFWPSGDRPEISLLFGAKSSVTCSELLALNTLFSELGDDSIENVLRIHHTLNVCGSDLYTITKEAVEDQNIHLFLGSSFIDLRKEAAYELFELYFPEAYAVWEKCHCDGLIFDEDRFLDSPTFSVDEVSLGDHRALIIAPQ
jgi:hypothetical protein